MLTEDWLSAGAILVSLAGLIGLMLLDSFQPPLVVTIGELPSAPDGRELVFRARIEKWKSFQDFDRLELSDGNTVSAIAPKKLGLDWNQNSVFEFVGRFESKPKPKLTIAGAKRID